MNSNRIEGLSAGVNPLDAVNYSQFNDYRSPISLPITNGANVISTTDARRGVIYLTGALSTSTTVELPSLSQHWILINATTGSQTVQAKVGSGGTLRTIDAGQAILIWSNLYQKIGTGSGGGGGGSPSGSNTEVQYNDGGSFGADSAFAWDQINNILIIDGHLNLRTAGEARFYDSDNSNYVGFKAPNLSSNRIWTLPSADGSSNQYLKTDGSGNLSWGSPGGGGGGLTIGDSIAGSTNYGLLYNHAGVLGETGQPSGMGIQWDNGGTTLSYGRDGTVAADSFRVLFQRKTSGSFVTSGDMIGHTEYRAWADLAIDNWLTAWRIACHADQGFSTSGNASSLRYSAYDVTTSTLYERFRFLSSGEWLLGLTSKTGSSLLQINGGVKLGNNSDVASVAGAGALRYNGGLQVSNGASWSTVQTATIPKRCVSIPLIVGETPGSTGAWSTFIVPRLNSSATTWVVKRVLIRTETANGNTTTIQVERSTGTGVFSGSNVLSSGLSITGGSTYEASTTGFAISTLSSGDKVRVTFSALGASQGPFYVELELEEQ